MKKRWMSLVLTVIMVLSLAGCGKSTELSSVSRDPARMTELSGSMKRQWHWRVL